MHRCCSQHILTSIFVLAYAVRLKLHLRDLLLSIDASKQPSIYVLLQWFSYLSVAVLMLQVQCQLNARF